MTTYATSKEDAKAIFFDMRNTLEACSIIIDEHVENCGYRGADGTCRYGNDKLAELPLDAEHSMKGRIIRLYTDDRRVISSRQHGGDLLDLKPIMKSVFLQAANVATTTNGMTISVQ